MFNEILKQISTVFLYNWKLSFSFENSNFIQFNWFKIKIKWKNEIANWHSLNIKTIVKLLISHWNEHQTSMQSFVLFNVENMVAFVVSNTINLLTRVTLYKLTSKRIKVQPRLGIIHKQQCRNFFQLHLQSRASGGR